MTDPVPVSGMKLMAWQGVALMVPAAWDLAKCTGGYSAGDYRVDGHDRVRVQVRWQMDRGGSLDEAARRAAVMLKLPAANQSLEPIGPEWSLKASPTLRAFAVTPSHEEETSLLVLKRQGGRVAVLRFVTHNGWPTRELLQAMIAGIELEAKDAWQRWAIYDMAWSVPPNYELAESSIMAGVIRLEFRHKRRWFAVRRFSTANAVMGTLKPNAERLERWVAAAYSAEWHDMRYQVTCCQSDADRVDLRLSAARRWLSPLEFRGILPRHRRPPRCIRVQWHRRYNKIICFELDRREADDDELFRRHIASYWVAMDQLPHSPAPPPIDSPRALALQARVRWQGQVSTSQTDDGRVVLKRSVPRSRLLRALRAVATAGKAEPTKLHTVELDLLGSLLWRWCGQGVTVQEMIERIGREFQIVPSEAALAVTGFVRAMGNRGLLELEQPPSQ